jgi:hypothetical protein
VAAPGGQLDDDGFRHFRAAGPAGPGNGAGAAGWFRAALAEAPTFFRGLAAALQNDMAAITGSIREGPP